MSPKHKSNRNQEEKKEGITRAVDTSSPRADGGCQGVDCPTTPSVFHNVLWMGTK